MEYQRSNLSVGVRRIIKRKENELDRKCRKIWDFVNPNGERYLFGNYCKNYDKLIVSIAYFKNNVGWISIIGG